LREQARFGAGANAARAASRTLGAQMTEGGALGAPAVDRQAADLEGSRSLGAGHAAIECGKYPDTKVFGVGFHASHATIPSMFLHFAIAKDSHYPR